MSTIAENDKGRLRFVNDELIIESKTSDAGALRFHSPNKSMGKISFCGPQGEERFILIGNREDGFKFQGNPSGLTTDAAMRPLLDVSWDGARYRVPILGESSPAVGRIALRAVANGRYVCAEGVPNRPLLANRDAVGEWELFEVVPA